MDPRFTIDAKGQLTALDPSPLAGRGGVFRLQETSPDWLLLLRSPSGGGITEKKPRVALAGDCAVFAVQDLIGFLGQSRWTGIIRTISPSGERTLSLKEGEVRSASSDSPNERIGEMIVKLGYVPRPTLEKALADAPPSRVGKVLVERGLLKPHDLYKCLQEQIAEIFHGMMLSKEGSFALIDTNLDDKALSHSLSISMQGLLMDSIRKIDELAQFRKRIPNGRVIVHRKKPSDGTLEPEEDQLLALVDGKKNILQLGQAGKIAEFEATRIVYRLLEGGYATISQSAADSPPAVDANKPNNGINETKVIEVFNTIFREVRNEVARRGHLENFLLSANSALRGSGVSTSPVLNGLAFTQTGDLPPDLVLGVYERLRRAGQMGTDPLMTLKQALSDVMFFLLFQAGELLESSADEALARRVKELLATLETR